MYLQHDYNTGPLTLLQLTDTHIAAAPGIRLAGVDTRDSLTHVLSAATARGEADLMLLTGDLSDDGSESAYRALDQQLAGIDIPQAWLPGNHDDIANMQAVAGNRMVQAISAGPWGIVLLNSQVPGAVGGSLADSELQRLAGFLEDDRYQHILVCVHHQPVPIGSRWLDEQRIANAGQLFELLDPCPRVRAVLWGHVHQECDLRRGGVRLLGTPSSCVQFAPGSDSFQVDRTEPGYRWLRLSGDGTLETRVERIDPRFFDVDYDCAGY